MKKNLVIFLCVVIVLINAFNFSASAEELKLEAKNAILIDMQNSMILYNKNGNASIQPAGFTKIVTALVVLENCDDLEQVIAAPKDTIAECDFTFGNMGVLGGEELSARSLLEGMLIDDAAEAAEVLAGFTFGDYAKFIEAMNTLAKNAGAENTVFKNAGGYMDDGQKTTLSDIAKISIYAMNNPAFAEIVKKDLIEIPATNYYHETRVLSNTNMFVGRARSNDFYSENVFGVKTSFMKDDGYGICAAFTNKKGNFICITNGNNDDKEAHNDAKALMKFSSEGFTNVQIAKKGDIVEEIEIPNGKTSHVLLKTADELSVRVPINYDKEKILKVMTKYEDLSAPVKKDQALGTLSITYDGMEVGSVTLVAYDSVAFSPAKSANIFFESIFTSPFFYVPVILLTLYFAYLVYKANKSKRNKKKH